MAVDQFPLLPTGQRAIKVVETGSIGLVQDVPLPPLGDEDVLVRVHCVALNPFDWKSLDLSPAPGSTCGCDFAGEVVAVGRKCSGDIQIGDRVFGAVKGNASDTPDNGGFAEYAAIREIATWRVPEGMGFPQAATLGLSLTTVGLAQHHTLQIPLPLNTALQIPPPLNTAPGDGAGRYVFIYGGGTATGTVAVQCAAHAGMLPVVASSPRHFSRLEALGAVACFDYHSGSVAEDVRVLTQGRLDAALDCITDSVSMAICYGALGEQGGRYVGLDQFPIRSHTRRDVRPEWIVAWTVTGEETRGKRPYARLPRPKHRVFGLKWRAVAQTLLDSGRMETHPIDLRSGGLAAIPAGVDALRKGLTDGRKLVFPIL